VGLSVSAKRGKDDYAKADTSTKPEVDAALETLQGAENRATASYVCFAAGGAALVAGAAVWLFTRQREPEAGVTLLPNFQRGAFTLSLEGSFAR
jgi:hypothetical protein